MLEAMITAALGVVCIVIGVLNMKGNISMLHAHHRKRVSEENRLPFGKMVGAGTIVIGIGLILGGIFFGLYDYLQNKTYETVGGILLGVGGLIRAYSHGATIALDAAGIITYEIYREFMLETTYSDYQLVLQELPRFGVLTDDSEFSDRVTLTLAIKATHYEDLALRLSELTAGRCFLMETGERFDYR